MSVRVQNSKTIVIDLLDFFNTRSIIPVFRIWTKEFILNDSSPLRDVTKHAIKVRHDVKCTKQFFFIMTTHVRHSERGSAICDCLVMYMKARVCMCVHTCVHACIQSCVLPGTINISCCNLIRMGMIFWIHMHLTSLVS